MNYRVKWEIDIEADGPNEAEGIFECEEKFGVTLTISTGRVIPTRWVGEQHVNEDLGFIPSLKDWLQHIVVQPWMQKVGMRSSELIDLNAVKGGAA